MTLISAAIILTFTSLEFLDYRRVYTDTSIVVDKSRGEKLTVNLNVTFPRVPCFRMHPVHGYSRVGFTQVLILFCSSNTPVLSLDVMDISGEVQRDVSHNILKIRLDQGGNIVPNSYSAQLQNDLDKMNEVKQKGYCGSCYGGLEPESGCCNTCDEVRTAYVNRGWSFSNPDAIEQVSAFSPFIMSTSCRC